jgi:hypothetical protein
MGNRIAIGLAASALACSVFASTSVGSAAIRAVIPVPLAKRAYLADTARNAIRVDGIKASRTPTAGLLLPLDATGKLPASIGAVGPPGPKGDKGNAGSPGVSGYEIVTTASGTLSTSAVFSVQTATCPSGKKVLGGGGYLAPLGGTYYDNIAIESSFPLADNRWQVVASVVKPPASPGDWQFTAYAICANVT